MWYFLFQPVFFCVLLHPHVQNGEILDVMQFFFVDVIMLNSYFFYNMT